MKKKYVIIISVVLLIPIIGGSIGYYLFFKPTKNFAESKADITLSAKALFDAFSSNEDSANVKYVSNDKTIQINGLINDIKYNDDSTYTVVLDVGMPDGSLSCNIIKEESGKLSKYKSGMPITVKGQCTGLQTLINKEVIVIRSGIVDKLWQECMF